MVSKREIYAIIGAYGLGRILPKGSTTKAARLTVRSIARPLLTTAASLARRHPVGAAATLGLGAYEMGLLDPAIEKAKPVRKRAMSKFNASVKKGMAIVKASSSYGKKGVINSPKKAFTAVTKTVSKVKQGKATPKRGILAKVAREARRKFKGIKRLA
jgi:hypothetical protein